MRDAAIKALGNHPRIRLCAPLDYVPFVAVMKAAYFILSDSGGVQEEAPALGKPVLVLRRETERPEAVERGVVKLVGPDYDRILDEAQQLLDDTLTYQKMARGISPYGDGKAAERIVTVCGNISPDASRAPLARAIGQVVRNVSTTFRVVPQRRVAGRLLCLLGQSLSLITLSEYPKPLPSTKIRIDSTAFRSNELTVEYNRSMNNVKGHATLWQRACRMKRKCRRV